MMLVILSLSLVSAHSRHHDFNDYTYKEKIVETNYYPSRHQTYTKTTYINYDNEKRYSTDEYKYGYSYRATVDYLDRHYNVVDYDRDYCRNKKCWNPPRKYKVYDRDAKDYYYEYIPYLREYQKRECYHEAPKGKLFYIKCP